MLLHRLPLVLPLELWLAVWYLWLEQQLAQQPVQLSAQFLEQLQPRLCSATICTISVESREPSGCRLSEHTTALANKRAAEQLCYNQLTITSARTTCCCMLLSLSVPPLDCITLS